jgi:hypothetical protein
MAAPNRIEWVPIFFWVEAQAVGANATCRQPEAGANLVAREIAQVAPAGEVSVAVGSVRGVGVGEDPHDDRLPGSDGAQEGVAGAVHDDRLVTFLVLLELKGDCNGIAKSQEGIVEADGALVGDELEVAQVKPLCASFALDHQVLAGVHRKEESAAGQLVGGSVERTVVIAAQFLKDAWSNSLLWTGGWIIVFVAL